MARTRGAKSLSPSSRLRPVQAATPEPPRPPVVPPSVEDTPISPPMTRYQTRRSLTMTGASSSRAQKSGRGPPKKKTKVSEPIDLIELSSKPESEPRPSQPPAKKPQPSQPPAKQSHIPSSMTPEVVIRRPMRRGVLLEALFRISEGYFFGPYHLIMAALLYFEEKVHKKKLLRADAIPLLFLRLLCQILEHLGYPAEPQLEPPAVASPEPSPEVAPSAPQATPRTPLVIPPISEPSPSSEPRIVIPIIEYKGLCHTFQALATS
ncbi:zyxin-like [Vitis riparia]|uniref:zyxin-like n=1 Tax=Vitis riparia TaxID=96939 RepID=UPI00155A157E|nr:zyxin-like [Vitis riparia]